MTLIAGREIAWAARQYRDRVAFVWGERHVTFREANRRFNRMANALRGLGLCPGDRVAVLMSNGLASIEAGYGAAKAGLALVPLNGRHTLAEHAQIVRDAGASVLLAGPEFEELAGALAETEPALAHVIGEGWRHAGAPDYEALLAAASEAEPEVPVAPDDVFRISYTSGTTGLPKGVVATQRSYRARLHNFFAALEYRLGVEDAIAHVGPLNFATRNYLDPYYLRGARNVILSRFDPEELQAVAARERVTHLMLVPTMIIRLLDSLRPERYDLSGLTRINYGTAPMPVEALRRGIEAFGPIFRGHYGLTEASQPITVLYPFEHVLEGDAGEVARLASCGRPIAGLGLALLDAEGRRQAPGEVGELCIRVEGCVAGTYWNNPAATAETFRGGWLHTGDLARQDAEGYVYIVGRSKDMIITGGLNVYAREVEEALFRHPGISEAAVVGIPDPEWGESILAFFSPRAGALLNAEEVIRHCQALIASYKKPRRVEILPELPKNNNGKIDKRLLRQRFLDKSQGGAAGAERAVLARY
ncbi:MAG: AMP-binding protein [Candidatus Lambdaproteobacteria bacterium]|nr:AMP-binding protein [Candidatus Lambdaproteobacteria bacterium]